MRMHQHVFTLFIEKYLLYFLKTCLDFEMYASANFFFNSSIKLVVQFDKRSVQNIELAKLVLLTEPLSHSAIFISN